MTFGISVKPCYMAVFLWLFLGSEVLLINCDVCKILGTEGCCPVSMQQSCCLPVDQMSVHIGNMTYSGVFLVGRKGGKS